MISWFLQTNFENMSMTVFEKDGIFFEIVYAMPNSKRWEGITSLRTNSPKYYNHKGISVGSDVQDIYRAYANFDILSQAQGNQLRIRYRGYNEKHFDVVFILKDKSKVAQIRLTEITD